MATRHQRSYTNELERKQVKERIVTLYNNGYNYQEILSMVHCGKDLYYEALNDAGILWQKRPRRTDNIPIKAFREMSQIAHNTKTYNEWREQVIDNDYCLNIIRKAYDSGVAECQLTKLYIECKRYNENLTKAETEQRMKLREQQEQRCKAASANEQLPMILFLNELKIANKKLGEINTLIRQMNLLLNCAKKITDYLDVCVMTEEDRKKIQADKDAKLRLYKAIFGDDEK